MKVKKGDLLLYVARNGYRELGMYLGKLQAEWQDQANRIYWFSKQDLEQEFTWETDSSVEKFRLQFLTYCEDIEAGKVSSLLNEPGRESEVMS